jgi:hypothetical protein
VNAGKRVKYLSWIALAAGLLIVYLVLTGITTQVLHFSRAHDEGYHLEYTTFIRQNGRLPISFEERTEITRGDFPPLYQMMLALLSSPVRVGNAPAFRYFGDSFRYQVVDHQLTHPFTLETEDLTPPYLGRFYVWQLGRGFSVLLSVGTLVLVFLTLWQIPVGPKPMGPLFGTAFLAFTPRFLVLSSSLNDDNLLALVAALYFWALIHMVKSPSRWWPLLLAGVSLGVSATVKYSLVLLPLEITLVAAVLASRLQAGWFWALQRIAVVGVVGLSVSIWWFGWNIWFFNSIAEDGLLVGSVRALFSGGYNVTLNQIGEFLSGGVIQDDTVVAATGSGTFAQWLRETFITFWSFSIQNRHPLWPVAHIIAGLLVVAAAVGLWKLWRDDRLTRPWLLLAGFHLLVLCLIPLLRFATSGRLGQTAQGRHILMPAATAIVALLAWGLVSIIPKRWHTPTLTAIIAGLVVWSGLHVLLLSQDQTPLLPLRTVAQAAEWLPEEVKTDFGDVIELVSYDLSVPPTEDRVELTLGWRSLARVNENYRLRINVVNQAGTPVAGWLGYNGDGRLPTLAWEPGDTVFDRLVLPLSDVPTGDYTVQLQLIGQSGPVLENIRAADTLDLTSFRVEKPARVEFPWTLVLDNGDVLPVAVWRRQGPMTQASSPFRYPDTISVLVDIPEAGATAARVELVDEQGVAWPADMVIGDGYHFIIGPRWPGGEYRLRVELWRDDQLLTKAEDALGRVENWWPRYFTVPEEVSVPLAANFADQLQLVGYTLPQSRVRAGEKFPITLYWQAPADKSPQANFVQFNHLLNADGELYGGYERLPQENYSTLLWAAGEVVIDGYSVPVDANAPPGVYYLDVGYYLTVGEAAINLPLVVDGEMSEVSSVTIGPIEVVNSGVKSSDDTE